MRPRPKMSLQDLKDLFASGEPGGSKPMRATQRGFAHKVNPAKPRRRAHEYPFLAKGR